MVQSLFHKRGQIYGPDIMVSMVIFIVCLGAIFYGLTLLYLEDDGVAVDRALYVDAQQIASSLIYTTGLPVNWHNGSFNEDSISALGIAERPGVIDIEKVELLQSANYSLMKELLGLRDPNYDIHVRILYDPGDYTLLGSSPVIAYTYADAPAGASEGDYAHYGIRGYLDVNEIDYANFGSEWEDLLANIDNYTIAIFEDPTIDDNDLTNAQKDTLRDWVAAGGIFIQKEHGRILEVFGLKYNNQADGEDGTVVALDHVLKNVQIGDSITCQNGQQLNKNTGNIVNLVESTSGHVVIGYANYSSGQVYYMCDTEGDVFNASDDLIHSDIRSIINFGGGIASLNFGKAVNNTEEVARVQRSVTLESYGKARMVVHVWKN